MTFKHLAAALALLALAGCALPSPYQPAQNDHATGYSDQRLADNRFRVSFNGNSVTRRPTVENFLLLRAAEVTRDAGYAWFVFDTRNTEAKTTYHTAFAGYPGAFGWYWHSWPYDPWDPYWAGGESMPTTRYEATAEIVLLTPDQAKADPHALQASDVIARLGPAAAPAPAN
ncbi:MAG TPA: hypothetical protein VII56_11755 [Rhizomicrobium sp.]